MAGYSGKAESSRPNDDDEKHTAASRVAFGGATGGGEAKGISCTSVATNPV